MAEEAKKKEAAPAAAPAAHGDKKEEGKGKGGGGLMSKLPVLLGGVMIIEAVVLFAGFKFLGAGAKPAAAATELSTEDTIKDKEPLIQDRIRTIIAESDPEKLSGGSEPGLETLRRQVKYQLDGIIGDGMIDEVLVPRCIPFRTDY
jgi:flagellar basal body-associated protein FliL